MSARLIAAAKAAAVHIRYEDSAAAFCSISLIQLAEELEAAMTEAEKPPARAWIPCSDRLPEDECDYLVTTNDGLICISLYQPAVWRFYTHITAWMPLPEPYRP